MSRAIVLSFLLLNPCLFAQSDPLQTLQDSWDKTRSYRAPFTQTVQSKGTGLTEDPSNGVLFVVKPDKLRWEDTTAGITQILNGKKYWDITENRRRKSRLVNYTPDISHTLSRSSLAILTGRGKFKDFYKVRLLSEDKKEALLQLIPKTRASETLIAKIDKNGYVLRSLTTDSPDSKVVVEFHDIQRNLSFPEALFEYVKKPSDVFQVRKE